MIRLNFDGDKRQVKVKYFAGGEVNVVVPTDYGYVGTIIVKATLLNSEMVMELLMVKDALDRAYPDANKVLSMGYVPYARQDRVCNPGEALSIKVFCDLINNMNFSKVYVVDPHSDVTPALLNNCKVITIENILKRTGIATGVLINNNFTLVSPDAGANKKVLSLAKAFGGLDVIRADKLRNTLTGDIEETIVYADDLTGKKLMVIDDIFDGGRTFLELGKKLREKNPKQVDLWVTHGIFCNEETARQCKEIYDNIYTTDTLPANAGYKEGIIIKKLQRR